MGLRQRFGHFCKTIQNQPARAKIKAIRDVADGALWRHWLEWKALAVVEKRPDEPEIELDPCKIVI